MKNNINGKYVSFGVAKDLKMMGFNDECDYLYTEAGELAKHSITNWTSSVKNNATVIGATNTTWDFFGGATAPLITDVVDWLRDSLGINMSISLPNEDGFVVNVSSYGFTLIATGEDYYSVINDALSKVLNFINSDTASMTSEECDGYILEWRIFNILSPLKHITEKCVCTIWDIEKESHVAQGSTTRYHNDSPDSKKAIKSSLSEALKGIVLTKYESKRFWKEAFMTLEYMELISNIDYVSEAFEMKNNKPVNIITVDNLFLPHIKRMEKHAGKPWMYIGDELQYNGTKVEFKDLGVVLTSTNIVK